MEDLTQNFRRLESEEPSVHESLRALAARLYDLRQARLPSVDSGDLDLSRARERGLVEVVDGEYAFADCGVAIEYVSHHAARLLLDGWAADDGLAQRLIEVHHSVVMFGDWTEVGATILWVLATDSGRSLLAEVRRAARTEPALVWQLWPPLARVLPLLEFDPAEFVDTIEEVLAATQGDAAQPYIVVCLQRLAKDSRGKGESILGELLGRPESPTVFLAPYLMSTLAASDIALYESEARRLAGSSVVALRCVGLEALGRLPYSEQSRDDLEARALETLESVEAGEQPEVTLALARSIACLATRKPEAGKRLAEFAASSDEAVRGGVLEALSKIASDAASQEWLALALLSIARNINDLSLAQQIDFCAHDILSADAGAALNVLEAIATRAEDLQVRARDLPERFSSTSDRLLEQEPTLLRERMTVWLSSERAVWHELAVAFAARWIQRRGDSGSPRCELHGPSLEALPALDIIALSKRVIARSPTDFRPVLEMLVPCLLAHEGDLEIERFFEEVMAEVVLYNFPGLVPVVQAEIERLGPERRASSVLRAAVDKSETYLAAWEALSPITELQPPVARMSVLNRGKRKQIERISASARSRSIIRQLVTTVPLKHGRRFTVRMPGGTDEPAEMRQLSHKIELPRGEFIDPHCGIRRRLEWASGQGGEAMVDSEKADSV